MTFDVLETSLQQGEPIELYEFTVYGQVYRYTTASVSVTRGANLYRAVGPMSRSEIEETAEIVRSDLTITVPHDFEITEFYDIAPPSDVILLTVKRTHRNDEDVTPWWSGRVLNCTWEDGSAKLHAESIYTSLKRAGLRRRYSRQCPHVVYGPQCRADETAFRITVALENVAGANVSAAIFATYPDDRFGGGFIEWEPTPGRKIYRGIKGHAGSALMLTHPFVGMTDGAVVLAYPGCKHDVDDCLNFFDNLPNYGGFPYIPRVNPWGGNTVF
jgi:uncharacterized phage protein (TIGR02218 family)